MMNTINGLPKIKKLKKIKKFNKLICVKLFKKLVKI